LHACSKRKTHGERLKKKRGEEKTIEKKFWVFTGRGGGDWVGVEVNWTGNVLGVEKGCQSVFPLTKHGEGKVRKRMGGCMMGKDAAVKRKGRSPSAGHDPACRAKKKRGGSAIGQIRKDGAFDQRGRNAKTLRPVGKRADSREDFDKKSPFRKKRGLAGGSSGLEVKKGQSCCWTNLRPKGMFSPPRGGNT